MPLAMALISTTLYLAAADGSTDPWHVLGNSYAERLAIAALADLTLARRLAVGAARPDESPAARVLEARPGPEVTGVLAAALTAWSGTGKRRTIDRSVHQLRNLSTDIAAALVASGDLVAAERPRRWRRATVLTAAPGAPEAAQASIRAAAGSPAAADRALTLAASIGLPARRRARLWGGATAVQPEPFEPFEPFDPAVPAPDGRPLGEPFAETLTALMTVLAATQDTTNDFE
jgi:hypothetical protein